MSKRKEKKAIGATRNPTVPRVSMEVNYAVEASMIRITTQTGATYDVRSNQWRHREGPWHRLYDFRIVDWETAFAELQKGGDAIFDYVKTQPIALSPQIGASIYVSDGVEWRVSTPVVSVKEVIEDDRND